MKGALKVFANEKGAPKTLEACNSRIEKTKEQITAREF